MLSLHRTLSAIICQFVIQYKSELLLLFETVFYALPLVLGEGPSQGMVDPITG